MTKNNYFIASYRGLAFSSFCSFIGCSKPGLTKTIQLACSPKNEEKAKLENVTDFYVSARILLTAEKTPGNERG